PRLRDVGPQSFVGTVGQGLHLVIALVGRYFFDVRCAAGADQIDLRRRHAVPQGAAVGLIAGIDLRRQDQVGVQVHDVLGLVGQVGGAVLHLGDAAVRVRGRGPLIVGDLLVLALPVEAAQLLVGGVLDAGLGRQLLEVLLPVLAGVLA